jgi:2-haloacid dehalogenase
MKTAFVARPTEHGPGQKTDLAPDPACVDVGARDFVDLGAKLGA